MESQTFYEILGVFPKCTASDIKIAYRSLIKKYHPDKCQDAEKGVIISINTRVKMINKAYEVLKNPQKRGEYDNSLKLVKKKCDDFVEMKRGAHEFLQSIEVNPDKLKNEFMLAKEEYDRMSQELDRKMGIENQIREERRVTRQTIGEYEKRTSQLETLRDQEYIENLPTKLCDNKQFNVVRFNEAFVSIAEETNSIIKYTGDALPYNEINLCKINEEDDVRTSEFLTDFSGRNIDMITSKPVKKFVPPTASLEDLMKERDKETYKLYNMKMYEYDTSERINACGSVDKTSK
jgi:curved DNA-binding protein CbpA